MKNLILIDSKDSFSFYVGLSLIGHAILVLVFTVKAVFFPSEALQIRSAIRVDVVGLPEKAKTEIAPTPAPAPQVAVPAKEEPKPVKPVVESKPKPVEKINLKNTKKDQQKAIDRLKALQAIENLKQQVGQEKKQKPQDSTLIKGNQVSEGNSLEGLDKIEFDRYFSDIEQKVKSNWNLPRWLADAPLRAQALVLIDEHGYITKKQILTSSGNEVFDTKVLETLDSSSPFPPPPSRLKNVLGYQGIVFNFPE